MTPDFSLGATAKMELPSAGLGKTDLGRADWEADLKRSRSLFLNIPHISFLFNTQVEC